MFAAIARYFAIELMETNFQPGADLLQSVHLTLIGAMDGLNPQTQDYKNLGMLVTQLENAHLMK